MLGGLGGEEEGEGKVGMCYGEMNKYNIKKEK